MSETREMAQDPANVQAYINSLEMQGQLPDVVAMLREYLALLEQGQEGTGQ